MPPLGPTGLIEEISVTTAYVHVKFLRTLKVSTIINENFVVCTDEATPVTLTDPFREIVIEDDYNSIARTLTLYWNSGVLDTDTDYRITFTNLQDASGDTISDAVVAFTTDNAVIDPVDEDLVPDETPLTVIDKTVKREIFSEAHAVNILQSSLISQSFYVTYSDPVHGEYYLEPDYNNGRVIVKFSVEPDNAKLIPPYVKVQRKFITKAPARWETVNANVSLDTNLPWVYIDFPALDHLPEQATPFSGVAYFEPGFLYFEENYKYRIIFSKDLTN